MKDITPRQIAEVCGGTYLGGADAADRELTMITTDSRKIESGCLFAAIRGARSDGHDFAAQALRDGAAAVLAERDPGEDARPCILVQDTVAALGRIAAFYRTTLGIPVVGVTGSVGKTSTKEMIASVLAEKFRVLKTQGNFNNELGLPLTVFRMREDTEVAVLEMGISDFGEMHRLAGIARPDVCVITNIGQCHLENLKDRDGVLRAKTEIFDFLKPDGHIVLNGDDDKLATVSRNEETVRFGFSGKEEIYADQIRSRGIAGMSCVIHTPEGSFEALVPMPGRHMVYNALAGTAVGIIFGLSTEEIRRGIENCTPVAGRFNVTRTGKCTVIDDCYNANPVSMKASLDVLKNEKGRKVAVLGDMGELGEDEKALHREVGRHAALCGIDVLCCAGELSREMADAFRKEAEKKGDSGEADRAASGAAAQEVFWFSEKEEMLQQLPSLIMEGDIVLVKASHFMKFDEVVAVIREL